MIPHPTVPNRSPSMAHEKIDPTRDSFLDLPAELRNEIYILDLDLPSLSASRTLFVNQHRRSEVVAKAICLTHKKIRKEALELHFERANIRLDAESVDDIYWTRQWLRNTALGGMLHTADRIELRHAHCASHNFKMVTSECRGVRNWGVLGSADAAEGSRSRERVVTSLGCVPCRRTWVILPKEKKIEVVPEMEERDAMCERDNHGQEEDFIARVREVLRRPKEEREGRG